MDGPRSTNASPTRPARINLATTSGYFANPTLGGAGTEITLDFMNDLIDEFKNVIQAFLGTGFSKTDPTQLLQCLNMIEAGIKSSTTGLFVKKVGDTMSGALSINSGSSLDLTCVNPAQVGGILYLSHTVGGLGGLSGQLQLLGSAIPAQTIGGVAYPATTSETAVIDCWGRPDFGNTLRMYKANYTAGNPILTFNIDTGVITANDIIISNDGSQSVSNLLTSIGNGGNLYVRGNGQKNIIFTQSAPGGTAGAATGWIYQNPTTGTNANWMSFSANGTAANFMALDPAGNLYGPAGITIPGCGWLSQGVPYYASWGAAGTYSWTVPSWVHRLNIIVTGGGGAGVGCHVTTGGTFQWGGGGGGAATVFESFACTPGQVLQVIIGAGGIGYGVASNGNPINGGNGGQTTVTGFISAVGGDGAAYETGTNSGGGAPGAAGANGVIIQGSWGADGQAGTYFAGGQGGGSYWGPGGKSGSPTGGGATVYGGGGGGGYGATGSGGAGACGLCIITY